LKGIAPGRGAESVIFVKTLLTRLDAAEKRGDTGALAVLARRGVTPEERRRLASLVTRAERYLTPVAEPTGDGGYAAGLRSLRAWYEEWSELARSEVSRKDYLLRLGLARRKRPTKAAPEAGKGTPTA